MVEMDSPRRYMGWSGLVVCELWWTEREDSISNRKPEDESKPSLCDREV